MEVNLNIETFLVFQVLVQLSVIFSISNTLFKSQSIDIENTEKKLAVLAGSRNGLSFECPHTFARPW